MDIISFAKARAAKAAADQASDLSTAVVIGDSLTEQGGMRSTVPAILGNSPWPWARNLLGGRLKVLANAGVGGETSASILSRFAAEVVARKPGWVIELSGTNDVFQGVPLETIKANRAAMWTAADRAGIRVVAGTIPPTNGLWTTADRAKATALNAWVKEQGRVRRNLHIADYHAALTDPATGDFRADTFAAGDGIHLSMRGGYIAGKVLAEVLDPLIPKSNTLINDPNDPTNLLGTGGRFQGGSGAVPTGWAQATHAVAPTYSKVARTDNVFGSWQSIVVPNGDRVVLTKNANIGTAGLAVGDTVSAAVEYKISNLDPAAAVGTQAFFLTVQFWNGSSFFSTVSDLYWDSSKDNQPSEARAGVLETPPFVVPVGATIAQFALNIRGGGTYLVDRAHLREV